MDDSFLNLNREEEKQYLEQELSSNPNLNDNNNNIINNNINTFVNNNNINNNNFNDEQFNLPELTKYDFRSKQFKEKYEELDNKEIKDITDAQIQYLRNNLQRWEIEKDQKWTFNLPTSIFDKCQNTVIQFHQHESVEYEKNQIGKLSQVQLDQIKKNGSFDVESQKYPIPYTWKLNPCIIKGYEEIEKTLHSNISFAFAVLYNMKHLKTYTRKGICNIFRIIPNLIDLFFGIIRLEKISSETIIRAINQQRQIYVLKNYTTQPFLKAFNIFMQGLDILPDKKNPDKELSIMNERNRIIQDLEQNFANEWKIKEKIVKKQFQELDEEKFVVEMRQQEKDLYLQLLIQNQELANDIKEHLLELLNSEDLLRENSFYFNQQVSARKNLVKGELINKHKIRSQVYGWLEDRVEEEVKPFDNQQKEIYINKQKQFLQQEKYFTSFKIYGYFLEFVNNYRQTYEKEKNLQNKKFREPSRQFEETRELFPPYRKVFRKNQNVYDNRSGAYIVKDIWVLEKYTTYVIKTDHYFWKVHLGFIRYYVYFMQVTYILYENAVYGRFGIKALFACSNYTESYVIDEDTGKVTVIKGNSIGTYWNSIADTCRGIQDSRDQFENSPDTGFFGKACSRMFNLIECYIFRLLILLVFVMALQPVLIIVLSVIQLLLSITCFAWMPIVLILRFVFQILIYDFDQPIRRRTNCFPLIYYLFHFIVFGIFQTIFSILLYFLAPILSLFVVIFAYFRKLISRSSDLIMYFFVKCCGREPISDNKIARKIAGIGISRQFYYQMDKDDLFMLIVSNLEKFELSEYQKELQRRINQPYINSSEITNRLFKMFGGNVSLNEVNESISYLNNCFQVQLTLKEKKYPKLINNGMEKVRFTQEELEQIFPESVKIIQQFLNKKNLLKKAYINYGLHNEEDQFPENLARKVWGQLFYQSEQLLTPIEDIELRFQLKKTKDEFYFNSISNAIKGEINLFTYKADINEKQRKNKIKLSDVYKTNDLKSDIENSSNMYSDQNITFPFSPLSVLIDLSLITQIQQDEQDSNNQHHKVYLVQNPGQQQDYLQMVEENE